MKTSEKSANGCFFQDSIQSGKQLDLSGEELEMKEIPEGYNKTYQELAGVLKNDRQVHAVWEHYAGVSVTFPKSLYSRKYTRQLIREAMDKEKPAGTPPNTFVPGRNLFFLSIAAVFAQQHGIRHIVTGVSQTDFSGYPDCRDAFIKSLNVTLNLALEDQFVLHTPLMWLHKCETWALADELGVLDLVRRETLTCYNGIPGDGCGECPACRLRRAGLEKYLIEKTRSHE